MTKLYEKSEIWFAVSWIILYVVLASAADALSVQLGVEKSVTVAVLAVMCVVALLWVKKNGLQVKYGLCRGQLKGKETLYFLPLVLMASCNAWFGFTMNLSLLETVFYVLSMIMVGFLEELIFRGFLFKAMVKGGLRSAVIVSSVTFGIGHIVNLINGSGADLLSNLLQVGYAVAGGFLFVVLFLRSGSLIPCILTHSAINALSAFAVEPGTAGEIVSAVALGGISLSYALWLVKTAPKTE